MCLDRGLHNPTLFWCRCSSRPPPWRCPWAWVPLCPWACFTSPRCTWSSSTQSRTSRRGSAASRRWLRRPPCPRASPRSPTTNRTESPRWSQTGLSDQETWLQLSVFTWSVYWLLNDALKHQQCWCWWRFFSPHFNSSGCTHKADRRTKQAGNEQPRCWGKILFTSIKTTAWILCFM